MASVFGSEHEMLAALRARFAAPEWAFLSQVRNGTGFQRKPRTADALAMSLWPSRGLDLHGIEVKVSRSDWLHEKKDPAKAEEIFRFCDRWWLAVGDESIVQPGELPPTWGLLVPRGGKLIAKVDAPKLEPIPMTRLFLAGMLRNAAESSADTAEISAAVAAALAEERKRSGETVKRLEEGFERRLDDARRPLADFEAASGIQVSRWTAGKVGAALKEFMARGPERLTGEMLAVARRAAGIMQAAEVALEELKAYAEDSGGKNP